MSPIFDLALKLDRRTWEVLLDDLCRQAENTPDPRKAGTLRALAMIWRQAYQMRRPAAPQEPK